MNRPNIIKPERDICDISAELDAVAKIIDAIGNPLLMEEENRDSDPVIGSALFGVSCYIARLVEDLDKLEREKYQLKKQISQFEKKIAG